MRKLVFKVTRFFLQVVFYIVERVLILADAVSRKLIGIFIKTEYERVGQCQSTGQCCRAIGIEFPKSWHAYPKVLNLVKKWHRLRFNFHFVEIQKNMLVYECHYLTADNKCSIHRFKPKLCRDFPPTPLFGKTALHKGCGYMFTKRSGTDFEEILQEAQTSTRFKV